MRFFTLPISLLVLISLSGCQLQDQIDNVSKQAQDTYNKYFDVDKPRPFDVVFQADPTQRQTLISSNCGANSRVNYVYYTTPADTIRNLGETQYFISYPGREKPYWDIRYVNPVSAFINGGDNSYYPDYSQYTGLDVRTGVNNLGIGTGTAQLNALGSITESECVGGLLAGGVNINLNDAPNQPIYYGGPQSTFIYQIGSTSLAYPWKADGTGNLALQASFKRPIYTNYGENIGGSVSFTVYIKNVRTGVVLNYIIGLYAAGDAWQEEKKGIRYDPTSGFVHVATVASEKSWWSISSPQSQTITEITPSESTRLFDDGYWPEFFRVNIAYANLSSLLSELRANAPAGVDKNNFGEDPSEWKVTAVAIQYELDEQGGKAKLSGSFRGFEVYVSQYAL